MGIPYYEINKTTGEISARFWLRFLIWVAIALELFWYTSGFASDLAALFSQDLAWIKLFFLGFGAVIVGEWVYFSLRWLIREYGIFPLEWRFSLRLLATGIILPFLFVFGWGWFFSLGFGKDMGEFSASVSLMMIFLFLVMINSIGMLLYLPHPVESISEQKEVLKIEVFYGGRMVRLGADDVAYVFYKDGIYYLTSHVGCAMRPHWVRLLTSFIRCWIQVLFL